MNWREIFTDEQLEKLNSVKNPKVNKILELSKEFDIADRLIYIFYSEIDKNNKNK